MGREIIGTLFGRWYVTLFGVAFVVLAVRQIGAKRAMIYAAISIAVGLLAENASVRYGVPYTRYSFNARLRGDELFVGDVPLMVALSYAFLSYFAFAGARGIVAGPWRSRSAMPVLEFLLAVVLGVWAVWVLDPISRLGAHFFLGELFHYEGPGFWFGLPLGSQAGFAGTTALLVGVLTWMTRHDAPVDQPRWSTNANLGALAAYTGQVVFMGSTAFVVARTSSDPAVVAMADSLAGSVCIIGVPMAVLMAVHWRSLALQREGGAEA